MVLSRKAPFQLPSFFPRLLTPRQGFNFERFHFYILAEARNRKLNISRICEPALSSILDYIPKETQSESSLSLTVGSLQRETSWAGRSAWYDRHVGIVEVPGSNPGPSTRTFFENNRFCTLIGSTSNACMKTAKSFCGRGNENLK